MAQSESGDPVSDAATSLTTEQFIRLVEEHQGGFERDGGSEQSTTQSLEELVEDVVTSVGADASFAFDDKLVAHSLDELLLAIIAKRDRDTNGNALIRVLEELFDSRVSPGTVYPALHDMDDEDLLEMFELVRSKEYRIADSGGATARMEAAAQQHLALGLFLYRAAQEA